MRLQFLAGDGGPFFTVDARFPDARPLLNESHPDILRAAKRLGGLGFMVGRDWSSYWSRRHPVAEWLPSDGDPIPKLLEIIRGDVRAIAESGLLSALPLGLEGEEPDIPTEAGEADAPAPSFDSFLGEH